MQRQHFSTRTEHVILHRRRRSQQIKAKLTFETFFNNLHMEQTQKTNTKTKTINHSQNKKNFS